MPRRADPEQGDQQERGLTVIKTRQRELDQAFKNPNKVALMLDLLGAKSETDEGWVRFKAVALNALANNTHVLQNASIESIMNAVRESLVLKLEPTGVLGEGYIIVRKGVATFEPGYRGLMKLARRSGGVDVMDAHVWYEHDQFAVELGTNPRIEHVPALTHEGGRGKPLGAYAFAKLESGELVIEPMLQSEIEKVRRSSATTGKDTNPWVAWPEEMARKTVIKRLMKRLPLGADAEAALRYMARLDEEMAEPRNVPEPISAVRDRLMSRLPSQAGVEDEETSPEPDGQTGTGETTATATDAQTVDGEAKEVKEDGGPDDFPQFH